MVNPVNDTGNRLDIPVKDPSEHRDLCQEKGGFLTPINVSFSEKAQELKTFEDGSPLVDVLKKEFDEVFKFGGTDKGVFLDKLNQILMNNGL